MIVPNDSNTYLPGTIQIPSSIDIIAATNAYPMVVTLDVNDLTESNTYIPGQLVRLTIPITYKMFQADGLVVRVLEVNGSDLSLDVDSRQFDPFVLPAAGQQQPASLAPSGSRNLSLNNLTGQVPFQSLNNRGN
jgi:hypothetical protein